MNEVFDQREALYAARASVALPHQPHLSYCWCPDCWCPDCRAHYTPSWPCGRPRRDWETPVPAPPYYPQHWPVITCATTSTGPTQLCN